MWRSKLRPFRHWGGGTDPNLYINSIYVHTIYILFLCIRGVAGALSPFSTGITSFPHARRAVVELAEGATNAGTDSSWIRRQLSDSVCGWACDERADDEDNEPKLSNRLIGWLILFMSTLRAA